MCAARYTIPTRPSSLLALAPAVLVACVGIGCQSAASQEQSEPAGPAGKPAPVEIGWEDRPLGGVASGVASPVAVKEGPAPLVYLTESGVTVRIVDRAGEKILAETPVPGRTIVRVDQQTGVVIGRQTLVAGPLPAGGRYAIMVVPQVQGVSSSGRTREVEQQQPVEEEVQERVVDPTGTGSN